MAQRPYVEDALEGALHDLVVQQARRGRGARHVHQDLVQRVLLVLRTLRVVHIKVLRHARPVLAPLALQRVGAPLGVGRQVAEQQLPAHGAVLLGDARPARRAQLGQVDDFDVLQETVEELQPLRFAR